MTLILRIENYDQLENGGPTWLAVDQRGASAGRRRSMDWVLPDPTKLISGHHFDISFEGGAYWITDVSMNGTSFQGHRNRLDGKQQLKGGEKLIVGHYIITAEIQPPQPQAPPATEQAPAPGEMTDLWGSGEAAPAIHTAPTKPYGEDAAPQVQRPSIPTAPAQTGNLQVPGYAPQPAATSADAGIQAPEFTWSSPEPLPITPAAAPEPQPEPVQPPQHPPIQQQPVPTPAPEAPLVYPDPAQYKPEQPQPAPSDPPAPAAWVMPPEAEGYAPPPIGYPAVPMEQRHQPAPTPPTPAAAPGQPPAPAPNGPPSAIPMPTPDPVRPVTPSPEPRPVNPPAAAPASTGAGDASSAMRAFFQGAGLDPNMASAADTAVLMHAVGQCLRATTDEAMQMLQSRADVKTFTRGGNRTMLSATANNPMKFMPDTQQALEAMFLTRRDGFMAGPEAFDDALKDIRYHQEAIFKALQPALAEVFAGLSPEEIEAAAEGTGSNLLSGNRKSKHWGTFVQRWDQKANAGEHGMLSAFLQAFARAYADAANRNGQG